MEQIALIGMGPSADQAPPQGGNWKRWGIALSPDWPTFDLAFEMHTDFRNLSPRQLESYRERLTEIDAPLYMQKAEEDFPTSRDYPLDEVVENIMTDVPPDCRFGSTLAYMFALAIHEDPLEIGLFGFELDGVTTEGRSYALQRPNVALLIGLALGRYVSVSGPSLPSILRLEIDGERYGVN